MKRYELLVRAITSEFNGIEFSDKLVANPEDYIPAGEFNPYNIRPWLIHDALSVIAIAFASCLQDALDAVVDNHMMDHLILTEEELKDPMYGDDEYGVVRLGNASEPFSSEYLNAIELPIPPFSFCALFNAHQQSEKEAANARDP